jgi:hypothetical protein
MGGGPSLEILDYPRRGEKQPDDAGGDQCPPDALSGTGDEFG